MFITKLTALVAVPLLAVGALLASAPAALADRGPGGQPNVIKIEGIVAAVDAVNGKVAIRTRAGVVTVAVVAATKIERNGRRATLSAFKIGDRAQAEVAANGIALKVEAVGP